MQTEYLELWKRVEEFSLDDKPSALSFTERLAGENVWPLPYARRVATEYKRFAFLAAASGHAVSPSDAVDQAWHLHLIYTESYWRRFCGEVLRMPLHHHPTKGGADERAKFNDWYARTLASYRRIFGEEPPSDIWPAPAAHAGEGSRFTRVSSKRNWIVPKPAWLLTSRPRFALLLGLATLFVAGCGKLAGNSIPGMLAFAWLWDNPLANLAGPPFLALYTAAGAATLYLLRQRVQALDKTGALPPLTVAEVPDPFEVAYLRGGQNDVLRLIVLDLMQRGYLRVVAKGSRFLGKPKLIDRAPDHPNVDDLPPMQRGAFNCFVSAAGPAQTLFQNKALTNCLETHCAPYQHRLETETLVHPSESRRTAMRTILQAWAVVLGLGAYKLAASLIHGRYNVGFLILLSVIFALAAIGFGVLPRLSRRGRDTLKQLQSSFNSLKTEARQVRVATSNPNWLLLVSLFGVGVLSGTAFADVEQLFKQSASNQSDGGGCGGGGCGGGGCGGG